MAPLTRIRAGSSGIPGDLMVEYFQVQRREPLQGLRGLAVDRPQRCEGIIWCEPVQVRVLPVEGCLQDLMYLMQSQGAVDLQPAPNRRLTVD
jgi:hypothetical protein